MKDGLRFVDCDMHVEEPPDLFSRYLDPRFKDRVVLSMQASGEPPTARHGLPLDQSGRGKVVSQS